MRTEKIQTASLVYELKGEFADWMFNFREESPGNGLSILHFSLTASRPQRPPELTLSFCEPMKDIQVRWTAQYPAYHHLPPYWWAGGRIETNLCRNAPVFSYMNLEGENRITYAVSDALGTVFTRTGPHESGGVIDEIRLFSDPLPPVAELRFAIRIDRRPVHYSDALRGVTAWYAENPAYAPAPVPEQARLPLYSTWYQFQRDVYAEKLEKELELAAKCNLKNVILDDGWNFDGETIPGKFAHAGDWAPAASKFPDMPAHVLRAHELGERLSSGQSAADGAFVDAVAACALRKSVFVHCTDDSNLHRRYPELFRAGMNVVTSNRRSLALPYAQYAAIKAEARENGCSFRYDTTVGNAIPILEYLAGGANCCDTIESIEAVVSCTLNYVITGYDGPRTDTLSTLLRKAQDVGLTEKDPRTDLGGRDVLRKLLILAREAGVPLEEGDVKITPLLPEDFFGCSLDEFYRKLSDYEPRFIEREEELDNMGRRQRFVASLTRDPSARLGYRAEISMRLVGEESPFYHISGTENVVIVRSEHTAPLVIKGAGEGVRLAATGIIRDILL